MRASKPESNRSEFVGQAGSGPRWAIFAVAALAVLGVCLAGGRELGRRQAVATAAGRLPGLAALSVSALASELDKQRVLCVVLAEDPEVKDALAAPSPDKTLAMNEKLASLRDQTGAGVIYLIDAGGVALAASNWREPDSFVGVDYRFRDYYRDAVATGKAEQFALGNISNLPGAYLARRVVGSTGVLVVKVEFGGVEGDWRRTGLRMVVTDPQGIVLLASEPRWRFHTVGVLDPAARTAIREGRQYGAAADLTPLPIAAAPENGALNWDGERYLDLAVPVRTTPWTLRLYAPIGEALSAGGRSGLSAAGSIALVLIAAGAIGVHRANRARARAAEAASFGLRLQQEVGTRTAELRDANGRLRAEIKERQVAEATLARLQNDLAQANRLAFLGQIAASVGHEINQPVAAIRTYADNAATFLERAQPEAARRNLGLIAGLTETIGTITDELRGFSRKAVGPIAPLRLDEAVNGALLLTEQRLRQADVELVDEVRGRSLTVVAERVRVEQILVNLIQNAAEALEGQERPARITLAAERRDDRVLIHVADTGSGLSPDCLATLFTPFSTGKANGLGVGLVVSQDLARDMGGSLSGRNAPEGGAVFTLELGAVC